MGPDPAPSPWGSVSGVGAQTGREVGGGREEGFGRSGMGPRDQETAEEGRERGRRDGGIGRAREARQVRVLALKGGSRRRMSAVATRVMRAASEAEAAPVQQQAARRRATASSDSQRRDQVHVSTRTELENQRSRAPVAGTALGFAHRDDRAVGTPPGCTADRRVLKAPSSSAPRSTVGRRSRT